MSFQIEKLKKFLDSLDAVKRDYTCGFCSELCKVPATLSTCFHMICSAHFDSLSRCPTCEVPLTGCTLYTDENEQACIDSIRALSTMVQCLPNYSTLSTDDSTLRSLGENSTGVTTKRNCNIQASKFNKENEVEKAKNDSKTAKGATQESVKANENISPILISSSSTIINSERRNGKGETALQVACRIGMLKKVLELLKVGTNSNTKDNAGRTPLHEVVKNGRLDLVQLLHKSDTLIDVPGPNNETPLHLAVQQNYRDIAVYLTKNGVNTKARNYKGETPVQLASNELKTILQKAEVNAQAQRINIVLITELYAEYNDDIRVHCISTVQDVHDKLKLLAEHHSQLHIEQKLDKNVTHLLVDTENEVCASSYDILQSIVNGIWIVSSDWIEKSTESKLKRYKDHEVLGVGADLSGPRNARHNKYKLLPGVFNGCHFYLDNLNDRYEISETLVVTKASLMNLINEAGGVVLAKAPNPEFIPVSERLVPYHAKEGSKLFSCSHYIIYKDTYEPMYDMPHIKALPLGWLIKCIERYELCEP